VETIVPSVRLTPLAQAATAALRQISSNAVFNWAAFNGFGLKPTSPK
jgi:hypothetical protein